MQILNFSGCPMSTPAHLPSMKWNFLVSFELPKLPGLFARRGCCHGEAAAHEIVAVYIEWAATKPG